jgi:hypothetical protein
MHPQTCPRCGFDIEPKSSERCPECGCERQSTRRSGLSRPLVPVPPGGPAWPKGRSIHKQTLIWLAIFLPLVALATVIIFWIISLVNPN